MTSVAQMLVHGNLPKTYMHKSKLLSTRFVVKLCISESSCETGFTNRIATFKSLPAAFNLQGLVLKHQVGRPGQNAKKAKQHENMSGKFKSTIDVGWKAAADCSRFPHVERRLLALSSLLGAAVAAQCSGISPLSFVCHRSQSCGY